MRVVVSAVLALALTFPVVALETDQFYAWRRPLADATDVLNAKINLEIDETLARINGRRSWRRMSCRKVTKEVIRGFNGFIFLPIELWTIHTELVDRIPATTEEQQLFKDSYLLHNTSAADIGTWVPPSPTIEINGVRLGTDKLAHFFSEGWMYYRWYHRARRAGNDHDEAERRAIEKGIRFERTILGLTSSGVLSRGDLEANHQGMLFMLGLCAGDSPGLEKTENGWRLGVPIDFRRYVTPEWDESYQPSIFGKRRWKKVRPVLLEYCADLDAAEVVERRRRYKARDTLTRSEVQLGQRIDAGKLADPEQFSIERNCPTPAQPASARFAPD